MFEEFGDALVRAGVAQQRNASIFMRVKGIDGAEPQSLRQVAIPHGLSSERVRQISDEVSEQFFERIDSPEFQPVFEKLREALKIITASIPATDLAVTSDLVTRRLLNSSGGTASSALRLAELVLGAQAIHSELWGDRLVLVDRSTPKCFPAASSLARKIAASSGVVSTSALGAAFREQHSQMTAWLSEVELRTILECCATLLCIDDTDCWFHFPESRSDALVRVSNHVSVLGSFQISSAADESSRTTRSMYHISVPPSVMAAYLRVNGYEINGGAATKRDTSPAQISTVQAKMVGILRRMGGSANSSNFVRACMMDGINSTTARVYMRRSGLFQVNDGICSLNGT